MELNEKQLDTLANCDPIALEHYAEGKLILDEYGCFYTIDEYLFGYDWDYGPELFSEYDN